MLTLPAAQTKVADIYRREGWGEPRFDWNEPRLEGTRAALTASREQHAFSRNAISWCEIARVFLDYHDHVVYTRGQKAATDAILAYANRDMGVPLYSFANDVREGFHLAETT